MVTKLRNTGISIVGDRPWGTHLCHFYETEEDLLETLVPYFKAGVENNEFCVWVLSERLPEEKARNALKLAVPDLDRCEADHSLEIRSAREWYIKEGMFDRRRAMSDLREKLDHALASGYAGMRVAGTAAWLEKKDWKSFCEYEKELNESITHQPMTVLCAYPLAESGAAEILDVAYTHQFAVVRRGGT